MTSSRQDEEQKLSQTMTSGFLAVGKDRFRRKLGNHAFRDIIPLDFRKSRESKEQLLEEILQRGSIPIEDRRFFFGEKTQGTFGGSVQNTSLNLADLKSEARVFGKKPISTSTKKQLVQLSHPPLKKYKVSLKFDMSSL